MASLLIGYADDPHLLAVARAATERGVTCHILDPHGLGDLVSIRLGKSPAALAIACGEIEMSSHIGSVWFRFKPIVELPHWGPMKSSAAQFAQAEWRTTLRALEQLLPDALWVNSPRAQNAANSKITQLVRARNCGFRIPETLISNDPDALEQFLDSHRRVVYKTLEFAAFPDQTGVYTTEIDAELVRTSRRAIRRAPGIFQEFIEKAFELRVTVVGRRVFTARINTPAEGKGAVDWRHNIFDSMYEACDLDGETLASIHAYQDQSDLIYAAYDFVCTPSGEIVFLECNPAGQYLWLEQEASLPISDAIADVLAEADLDR